MAFIDHGTEGTGEAVAELFRPGNAGSNTAADHIPLTKQVFAQFPGIADSRAGKKVLIRTDGAGASHRFVQFLGRRSVQ